MKRALLKKATYLYSLLFIFIAVTSALAQGVTVQGRVVDENSEPLLYR